MSEKDTLTQYFREAQVGFSRFFAVILTQAGLTLPQYALLNQLSASGAIPMTQASRLLRITKPAVTNLVDRLEKNNYLKRLSHPKDRRVFLLEIQPKGMALVRDVQNHVLKILLEAFSRFSEQDQKTITRFYAMLVQNLAVISTKQEPDNRVS
jgi:DNA-binding MarR family transcriptional regulator